MGGAFRSEKHPEKYFEKFPIFFEKPLDKLQVICYNIVC